MLFRKADWKSFLSTRRYDEELRQSATRILFFTSLLLILGFSYPQYLQESSLQWGIVIYVFYIIVHTTWIIQKSGKYFFRRLSAIIADLGFLSFLIYKMDISAIILYPLTIWIIMGNGIRFGDKYFYIALSTGILFLSAAIYFNPFWSTHIDLGLSMVIGLTLITLLNKKTLSRINLIHKTLDNSLQIRVSELEREYHHDTLTGLKNRLALEKALKEEKFTGLMVIDIDGFRNINELYGMHTGNQLLQSFARSMKDFIKDKPFELYRIYSDVFALKAKTEFIDLDFYEETIEELFAFVEKMQPGLNNTNDAIKLDITIGISLEEEDALNKAEMALSFAKGHAKKFIAYSKMIDKSKTIHQLLQRKNEIKDAIISDNFIPVFQPIVNRSREVVKYEALIRMRKIIEGKEQLLSPYFFLDAAVKTKQYETLTLIMIDKSFTYMNELGKAFSLNLSFNDMLNEKVLNALKSNIEKYNIGKQLTVEILESENVDDYVVINNFITEFKKMGVLIAIDDFGSGFSNFTHVFKLEPDILKIDGSLIKNIDNDKKSYEFVKSIVQLAKALQIETLAEFVSSEEIFKITYDLGIDYFQGYYFSAPVTYETLAFEKKENKV
jgi:diguanylate cyclase (GGDEF)-like protein